VSQPGGVKWRGSHWIAFPRLPHILKCPGSIFCAVLKVTLDLMSPRLPGERVALSWL
jgi:hypothetical protein